MRITIELDAREDGYLLRWIERAAGALSERDELIPRITRLVETNRGLLRELVERLQVPGSPTWDEALSHLEKRLGIVPPEDESTRVD